MAFLLRGLNITSVLSTCLGRAGGITHWPSTFAFFFFFARRRKAKPSSISWMSVAMVRFYSQAVTCDPARVLAPVGVVVCQHIPLQSTAHVCPVDPERRRHPYRVRESDLP